MLQHSLNASLLEAGCDEAGRGCLAGPVMAAAVILPPGFSHPLLNDSKQMSRKNRQMLRRIIEEQAVAWAVEQVTAERIDAVNILNASIEAMNLAVEKLSERPQFLLIDGNRFRTQTGIPFKCIVGGDGLYANIAAASVLAKTHRDQLMEQLHEQYPQYGWNKNMGYPTAEHRQAIARWGLTPWHRTTFRNPAGQLTLF